MNADRTNLLMAALVGLSASANPAMLAFNKFSKALDEVTKPADKARMNAAEEKRQRKQAKRLRNTA